MLMLSELFLSWVGTDLAGLGYNSLVNKDLLTINGDHSVWIGSWVIEVPFQVCGYTGGCCDRVFMQLLDARSTIL